MWLRGMLGLHSVALMILYCMQAVLPVRGQLVLTVTTHEAVLILGENTTVNYVVMAGENPPLDFGTVLAFNSCREGIIQPISPVTIDIHIDESQRRNLSADSILANFSLELVSSGLGSTALHPLTDPSSLDISLAILPIRVLRMMWLRYLNLCMGWLYFVFWSLSFYPQIISNFRRRSVRGLNMDFVILNSVGFLCYAIFNLCIFFIPSVQREYRILHQTSEIPVQLNDVVFAVHATVMCLVTLAQCFLYEKDDQGVSKLCRMLLTAFVFSAPSTVVLLMILECSVLSILYLLSYFKLAVTMVKYIPQAIHNYRNKSTEGWSIGNILLDFSGGLLSIAQMFGIAYNASDWTAISGNLTKLGLGVFSIVFDIFFMMQHYVWYKDSPPYAVIPTELLES